MIKENNSQSMKCKTEKYEAIVPVEEYMEKCVDVPTFLEFCKKCDNYERIWSCPSFDFDSEDYWKKYQTFQIVGVKIYVPEELLRQSFEEEERNALLKSIILPYKKELDDHLWMKEQQISGTTALSAGSCQNCPPGECTRLDGKPCRHPGRMRYSIESLGGNVGLTVTKYLNQELLWIKEGKLPEYFILVGGLLIP